MWSIKPVNDPEHPERHWEWSYFQSAYGYAGGHTYSLREAFIMVAATEEHMFGEDGVLPPSWASCKARAIKSVQRELPWRARMLLTELRRERRGWPTNKSVILP